MKSINEILILFLNCTVGNCAATMMQALKEAVKSKNISAITKIINVGNS